jgi:serine/threonine-protein kinase HipA
MMSEQTTLLVQLQKPSGDWVDVGLLRGDGSRNWFEFLESYWELADRPVLGQVFEEHGRFWRPNAHVALPRWFSHLLPEGRLREAVANAAGVSRQREFELIRRLGTTDLPGAIRVVETVGHPPSSAVPALIDEHDDEQDPLLKFSLAGAQLKFSVHGDERGLTVPARGRAGNCILKLPDLRPGFSGVPETELGALSLRVRPGSGPRRRGWSTWPR